MADLPSIDPGSTSKLIAGSLGAFLSLRFVQGTAPERCMMAAGGAALSFYGSTPLSTWVGVSSAEGLVGFLLGVFGMAVIAKVYEGINGLDAKGMVQDAWKRVAGRLGGE